MISCEKDEFLVKCKCWSCCSHAVNVCSHGWCILRILSVYFVLKSMFFSDAGIGLHFSSTRTWLSILLSFTRLSLAIASALLFSVSKAFIQIQCKICITQWRGLGQFDVVICCFGTMTITKKQTASSKATICVWYYIPSQPYVPPLNATRRCSQTFPFWELTHAVPQALRIPQ